MTEQVQTPETNIEPELSQAQIEAIHQQIQKQKSHTSGSGWFYWIAGLSLITSGVTLAGGSWSFLAGLGITQVFDGFAIGLINSGTGAWIKGLSLSLDLAAALVFICIGVFARKGAKAAYITGIALYAVDTCILLVFQDWFGVAFHGFALFQIWGGYVALKWLAQMQEPSNATQPKLVGQDQSETEQMPVIQANES